MKEVTYHVRWSSEWVIRLGDGTEESKQRMLHVINELWNYTGEMFEAADYEIQVANEGIVIDLKTIQTNWNQKIRSVFDEATLPIPQNIWMQKGGKEGKHTEHLGFILAEMQFMQRAYPNSEW